jgi:CubicO group peptidase (beta-lactamase class C family)
MIGDTEAMSPPHGHELSALGNTRRQWMRLGSLGGLAAATAGLSACAQRPAPVPAAPQRPWQPAPDFLADLPRLMRACQVPGVAVATLHQGELAWQHHQGLANAQTGAPLRDSSVFEAASLSKPVLAWLALRMVQAGSLDLDQPLLEWLRPADLAEDPRLALITPREVLRHTSGLPNWRRQPMSERLATAFVPGSRVGYSGEAFVWLQRVMEQRAGLSLDLLAEQWLWGPAGLRDSSFTWNDDLAQRSVQGHAAPAAGPLLPLPPQGFARRWAMAEPLARRWGLPLRQWRWAEAERAWAELGPSVPTDVVAWPGDLMANGAASLRCTAADYARFLRVLMPMADAPHLSPALQALATEPQVATRPEWGHKTLGWNLEQTRFGPVLHHAGNNANQFRAFALAEPRTGRALVVLTNGGGGATVCQHIVRAATGLDLLAFEP